MCEASTSLINTVPCKLLAKDLINAKKISIGKWELDITNKSYSREPKKTLLSFEGLIWLQGYIDHIAGFDKQVMIINDKTGRVKITIGTSVPGDLSWIDKGVYCSVIGCLIKETGLPVVKAIKVTNLNNNPVLSYMWQLEVEELQLLLTNQAWPNIDTT